MTTALIPLTAAGPLGHQWFGVASSAATQEEPVAVRLLGNDLVLWRSPNGTVVAAPDRCTHSRRPLSKGTVDNGRLVCAKHGWTFGDEGRCVFKPSGLPIAESAHLKTYPCTERYGVVWMSLGDPGAPVIDLPWDHDERFRRIHSAVSVWQANPINIVEAALAQPDSGSVDVIADVPFVVHSAFSPNDATQHHRLLSCAPVDGRSSLVMTLVWTTDTGGPDDAKIVGEATADLDEVKAVAGTSETPSTATEPPRFDECSISSDWRRRLLTYLGQGA